MRKEHWPSHLQTFLDYARTREFAWGDFDCCQFAGLAVEAQTGSNPIADARGRYGTAVGAQRVLRNSFGGSLRSGWTQVLGEPIPPALAQRGDVVLVEVDGVEAIGVVDLTGERVAVLTLDGLEYVTLSAALAAWRV